jgi:hypothetical protein
MRHNYLTRESFVPVSEEQARNSLRAIPAFASHIEFLSENRFTESLRFRYAPVNSELNILVDVTVLPLNESYTRISLHGTYETGQALRDPKEENKLGFSLHDFEKAAEAAIRGEATSYEAPRPRKSTMRQGVIGFGSLLAFLGFIFLGKRLS